MKQEIKEWFDKHVWGLHQFEAAMVQEMAKKDVKVEFVEDIDSNACLMYSQVGGKLYEAVIALNELTRGGERVLFRIIAMSHEIGHYIDIVECHGGNVIEFEAKDEIEQEQHAWQLGIKLLEASGYDKFGLFGWRGVHNVMTQALASYHVQYHSKEESLRLAKEFAKHVLGSKLEVEHAMA